MNEFAKLFTAKRIEKGLLQDEIANMLNVTRQAVSKWERGKAMPDILLMPQIAEILGVSVSELLGGKEPERQVEIVEKVVIQEKEVVKPMPARKIVAIVAPIVLVIILAATLMGVYIPKAIIANTPPTNQLEPNSDIVFTKVYVKGRSNTDDSLFRAPLIEGKAYYALNMLLSGNYTIYINAPRGAVAKLNGEIIAEFNVSEFAWFTRYFKRAIFNLSENITLDSLQMSGFDNYPPNVYLLEIDMTNCHSADCKVKNQCVIVRQQSGFEGVTIPANSTYYVPVPISDSYKADAHHYNIKSEGILFEGTHIITHSSYGVLSEDIARHQLYACEPTEDFYIIHRPMLNENAATGELYVGLVNITNNDIAFEVEEVPIEEIELGQVVTFDGKGIHHNRCVYKLVLERDTILMNKYMSNTIFSDCGIRFFGDIYGPFNDWRYQSICGYDDGWNVFKSLNAAKSGVCYIIASSHNGGEYTFVIDDWDDYNRRYLEYTVEQEKTKEEY